MTRRSWRVCVCGSRAYLYPWGWQCNGCGAVAARCGGPEVSDTDVLEFEAGYAERSGLTVAQLRAWRTVRRCDCGDDLCTGFAMIPVALADDWDAPPYTLGQVPGPVIEGLP